MAFHYAKKDDSGQAKNSNNVHLRTTDCCAEERRAWRQQYGIQTQPAVEEKPRLKARLISRFSRRPSKSPEQTPLPGKSLLDRILDLPAELREQIYISYLQAWGAQRLTPYRLPSPTGKPLPPGAYYKPIPPHEPPLTQVCRNLRVESLPLFYSTYRFPIICHLDHRGSYFPVRWYENLDPDKLKAIRHIEVYFCLERGERECGFRTQNALSFDLDFDAVRGTFTVSRHVREGGGFLEFQRECEQKRLEGHLLKTAAAMIEEGRVGNFTAEDFYGLVPPGVGDSSCVLPGWARWM